ncbi:MAG: DMT family transporter [Patescibacteria group bacterium]|nr:DMT family transporter [Patescibacteria group bacterium]
MIPPVLLPILAVCADSGILTITKKFFRQYGRLTSREFNWLQFAGIVFVLLLALPFFGSWPSLSQAVASWWLILIVVILATTSNLLYFWGIEHEKISEVEPFLLFNPLGAILIAGAFYAEERSWPIYVAVGIASLTLLWLHHKKHRFALTKGLWAIVLFMVAYSFEAVAIKTLLAVYDPIVLYFVRSSLVLVALTLVARPNFSIIKRHHLGPFAVIGALAVVAVVSAYSAFHALGLSHTIFIFVLSPILVYILSVIFLHEQWRVKNIIASIIVTLLVVWASLMH